MRDFDPQRLLRTLVDHDVRFVLIGGWAAKLHGSPTVTGDIDICYARDRENLGCLASAMAELDVRLRGVEEDVPFRLDDQTLRTGDMFTLSTSARDLDLLGSPAGAGSFEAFEANADELELDELRVRVASIADLIRMKRAAGRPKDLIELEVLEALRDEMSRSGA